jgi:hypothetical protein
MPAGSANPSGGIVGSTGVSGTTTANIGAAGTANNASSNPSFLAGVQSKSTPAKGLNGAAMNRVNRNEQRTTSDLNRASATYQASMPGGGGTITQ